MKRLIFPIALLALGLLAGVLAWAQAYPQGPQYPQYPPQGQPPQGQDDPADAAQHGVARLSLINGSVTVIRGDSGDSASATVNEPLVTTDRITTRQGSRAEVQFDSFNMIRLGANSDVQMGDLQYRRYLVQINQGTTLFRVLRDTDAQIEISTPSVSVVPLRQGIYRVTVRPDGSSEITVRAGEADLISPSGTELLPGGQTMLSRGSASDSEFMSVAAIPQDEWDRWNADRDRFFERGLDTSRYAGPDIDGVQELSNYGRWAQDPSYGNVWVPDNVGPDWAPYRDGRWDYINYYGWSWTSNDPWGWAPYHYGNWYRGSFGWAWYPGAIGQRHYWRPAMVGFFGFGSPGFGASLGFGYGNVGWVPLAPFERFRPWYGRGYGGGRNLSVINNTNIAGVYRNARISGAVTGLRAGDFGRVGVGRNRFVRPDSGDLARGGMVNGGMPFAPARNFGAGNAARFNSPGRTTSSTPNNFTRFNNGAPSARPSNGGFSNPGSFANSGNSVTRGGWRRLDSQPSAPPVGGNRSDVRIFGGSQREQPQPVRISPPIVNNRYEAAPNFRGASAAPDSGSPRNAFGGFGGPRSNGGGPGFGPAPMQRVAPMQQAAPPPQMAAPQQMAPRGDRGFSRGPQGGSRRNGGGEFRGAPPSGGGGPRGNGGGGGGGGGNRGGGRRGGPGR